MSTPKKSPKCGLIFNRCCWHPDGILKYDARERGCQIPNMQECVAQKCCKCGRRRGVKFHWDGVDVVFE
jgi:hypothetical protein